MKQTDEITTFQSFIELCVCLLICLGAAVFGILFLPGEWYDRLIKPSWIPPDEVFSWVWSGLYVLMGIAIWLVWIRRGSKNVFLPMIFFMMQLILNAAWSWIFFGLQRPDLALADASLLWVAILITVILFWRRNVLAGVLLVPYLFWVSFAVMLNSSIWRLNG